MKRYVFLNTAGTVCAIGFPVAFMGYGLTGVGFGWLVGQIGYSLLAVATLVVIPSVHCAGPPRGPDPATDALSTPVPHLRRKVRTMITTKLQDPTRRPLATLLRNPVLYQRWLERRFPNSTAHPTLPTAFPAENGVLLGQAEVDHWVEVVRRCGLPEYIVPAKNWDSLAALGAVLGRTDTTGRVLDAGGIMESVISSWLWLYGFRDLWCINPVFAGAVPARRDPLRAG